VSNRFIDARSDEILCQSSNVWRLAAIKVGFTVGLSDAWRQVQLSCTRGSCVSPFAAAVTRQHRFSPPPPLYPLQDTVAIADDDNDCRSILSHWGHNRQLLQCRHLAGGHLDASSDMSVVQSLLTYRSASLFVCLSVCLLARLLVFPSEARSRRGRHVGGGWTGRRTEDGALLLLLLLPQEPQVRDSVSSRISRRSSRRTALSTD